MLCDNCNRREVAHVLTQVIDGERVASYLCMECHEEKMHPPSLDRPCAGCRKREGTIPVSRLTGGHRRIRYLCQECADKLGGRFR